MSSFAETGASTAPNGAASGDLGSSYPSPTVVSLTGSSGSVSVASTGNIITWVTATTAPGIKQANNTTNSATGATFTVQAQNATGTTTTGGALNLTSGTGTTTAGQTRLQTGGTTRLTAGATGVITIANLGTGVVHADSSGNLTSSTIIDADVSASAAIALTKLSSLGLANYSQLTYNGTSIVGIGVVSSTLTDASVSINVGTANQFVLPAATLSTNRTVTLATTSAVTNEMIVIVRLDATANTLAIVNGGTGAGTIYTFPVSSKRSATFSYDGTNFYHVSTVAIN